MQSLINKRSLTEYSASSKIKSCEPELDEDIDNVEVRVDNWKYMRRLKRCPYQEYRTLESSEDSNSRKA
ncbi:MAG: hypothetical protein QXE99_04220 [Acidilobaceae archaeon]